jgi:hypothetical protein
MAKLEGSAMRNIEDDTEEADKGKKKGALPGKKK